MNKKILAIAIAAAMAPPVSLANEVSNFRVGIGAKGNKYKPHQGKKECKRRLKKA